MVHELPQALVNAGAIGTATKIMEQLPSEGAAQLAGVEAMSSLVGNRWDGLKAFAEVGGMGRIEAAMKTHRDQVVLQTKGIRALASGIQWPEDIQKKASYDAKNSIELTKAAMAQHGDCQELLLAGLEAFSKYLTKLNCKDEVLKGGGEGLVKLVLTRHNKQSEMEQKIQSVGRVVLTKLGVDRSG